MQQPWRGARRRCAGSAAAADTSGPDAEAVIAVGGSLGTCRTFLGDEPEADGNLETSHLNRFRGARRISRKIAPCPPPLPHTKCKTWNRDSTTPTVD
jgi:hypothetical protein